MNQESIWRGRLLLLTLVGYPMIAALTSLATSESSIPSIFIRIVTAMLGIALFIAVPLRLDLTDRAFLIAWLGFWAMYFVRILYDGFAHPVVKPLSGTEYLSYTLTFSVLPVLGAFGSLEARQARKLLLAATTITGVALFLSGYAAFSVLSDLASLLSSRVQLEKLNPISLGMLGGSMLVLVVCLWSEHPPRSWFARLANMAAALVAVVAIGLSGSKGPLLATSIALVLHYALPLTPAKLIKMLCFVSVAGAVVLAVIPALAQNVNIALISRLNALISGESVDPSNVQHLLGYQAAWQQFLSSPIWGDAIVESELHYYPHNVFLDVAMSTGLLGLACFGFVFVLSLLRTWQQLSNRSPYRWIYLLNLLNIAGAQVAGGIFQASTLWFFLVLSCFMERPRTAALGRENELAPHLTPKISQTRVTQE